MRPFISEPSMGWASSWKDNDEIAIWERSLTHEEIGNAWNQPLDGSEEGLLGLWKFDDETAKDQASYGFDGELNGGAVIEAASIPMFGGDVSTDILSVWIFPDAACAQGESLSPDSLC